MLHKNVSQAVGSSCDADQLLLISIWLTLFLSQTADGRSSISPYCHTRQIKHDAICIDRPHCCVSQTPHMFGLWNHHTRMNPKGGAELLVSYKAAVKVLWLECVYPKYSLCMCFLLWLYVNKCITGYFLNEDIFLKPLEESGELC